MPTIISISEVQENNPDEQVGVLVHIGERKTDFDVSSFLPIMIYLMLCVRLI